VRQTLQLMGRKGDERISSELAREICQRMSAKAFVAPSIAALGSQYVVTIDAVNAATGENLAEQQAQAESKEKVLDALGTAVAHLRSKLGESLASVQKFDKPLAEATTSSLEALKSYSLGQEKRNRAGDDPGSIPFYQRAIELDPNFASAYAALATIYRNAGETDLAEQNRNKAFELAGRASEHERLYITAHYYLDGGQIQKGIAAYELYKQTYPLDPIPVINLGVLYSDEGEIEKSIENTREALRIDPDRAFVYGNLVEGYLALGRIDEAKAVMKAALDRNVGVMGAHQYGLTIAIAEGDEAAQKREEEFLRSDPNAALRLLNRQANRAAQHGQLRQAVEFRSQLAQERLRRNQKDVAASDMFEQAAAECMAGLNAVCVTRVESGLKISDGNGPRQQAGVLLTIAGQEKRGLELLNALLQKSPLDERLQRDLATAKAIAAYNHGDTGASIQLLQPFETLARANPYLAYQMGLTNLKAARPSAAIQEFHKIIDGRARWPLMAVLPLARLGEGRAYAAMGNKEEAKKAYQDFLATWKDADAGIPLLKEAKAEYAKLQ
jgi:eukaryotic-like serine/threonine-protein kinase